MRRGYTRELVKQMMQSSVIALQLILQCVDVLYLLFIYSAMLCFHPTIDFAGKYCILTRILFLTTLVTSYSADCVKHQSQRSTIKRIFFSAVGNKNTDSDHAECQIQ